MDSAGNTAGRTQPPQSPCPTVPPAETQLGSRACEFASSKEDCKAEYEKGLACDSAACSEEASKRGMLAFQAGMAAVGALQGQEDEASVQKAVDAVAMATAYGDGVADSPFAKAVVASASEMVSCPEGGPLDPEMATRYSNAAIRVSQPIISVLGDNFERQLDAMPCEPAKEGAKQLKKALAEALDPGQRAVAAKSCELERRVKELEAALKEQGQACERDIEVQREAASKAAKEADEAKEEAQKAKDNDGCTIM